MPETSSYASSCFLCSRRSPLFNSLSPEELHSVNRGRKEVQYRKGETIVKQGAPCNSYFCITEGMVKLMLEDSLRFQSIIGLIGPVDYVPAPGDFAIQRYSFSVIAVEETRVCIIDREDIHRLIRNNPVFAMDFIKKLSQQTIDILERLNNRSHKKVYGRMAASLLYLTDQVWKKDTFTLNISRQDLADLSGMTKETSIRVLRKFQDDHIIRLNKNDLEILDKQKLGVIIRTG